MNSGNASWFCVVYHKLLRVREAVIYICFIYAENNSNALLLFLLKYVKVVFDAIL